MIDISLVFHEENYNIQQYDFDSVPQINHIDLVASEKGGCVDREERADELTLRIDH